MADTVSSIRINTKLVTDGIKRDKKEIERQLRELEKSAQSIRISKEIDKYNKALEKSQGKVKELEAESLRVEAKIREINQSTKDGTKEFEKQVQVLDRINSRITAEETNQETINSKIQQKQSELKTALQLETDRRNELLEENSALKLQEEQVRNTAVEEEIAALAAEKHTKAIKNGIKKTLKLSLAVFGIRAAYTGIQKIVSSVTEDNEKLANTIDAIWAGLGSAFEPIINGMIQGFATVLNYAFAIINALTGINLLSKANKKLQEKKKGSSSSGSKLASFDSSEVLKNDSGSGSSTTDTYLKEIELNEKLLGIIEKIKEIWGSIMDVLQPLADFLFNNLILPIGEWAGGALLQIIDELGQGIQGMIDIVKEFGPGILESLMGLAEVIVQLWYEVIEPVLSLIVDWFCFTLGAAINVALGFLKGWYSNLANIIDDVKLIFEGIINFLTGVFTGDWSKAWFGVQQIFAGIWNGMIDIVQSVVDGIANAINAIVDAINSISFDIPDWVPIFGGQTFSMNLGYVTSPNLSSFKWIPQLAKGAVLQPNQPFVAMLGDQTRGRNLEAPESLIRQIVREESGNGPVQIIIKADGDLGALVRLLNLELDEESNRIGTKLVLEG